MKLLFHSPSSDHLRWEAALRSEMPGLEFVLWPQDEDLARIDVCLCWKPPSGAMARMTNLKLLHLISAGTDQIANDDSIPADLPVARLVEPSQIAGMIEYVVHAVLRYHRRFDAYHELQRERRWHELPRVYAPDRTVGILGMGAMGLPVAGTLLAMGLSVSGWSRSEKSVAGIPMFTGWDTLGAFLNRNDIVIGMLPLSQETRSIYNDFFFDQMRRNSYFVNVGRGAQCDMEALRRALESGRLSGAMLDVLPQEPLSPDDLAWSAVNLTITPHIATSSIPESGARHVAENLRRLLDGRPLLNPVERF